MKNYADERGYYPPQQAFKSCLFEWRTLTGQHFWQAFSHTDKIVIRGRVLVVFCCQMVAQFAYKGTVHGSNG